MPRLYLRTMLRRFREFNGANVELWERYLRRQFPADTMPLT